MITFLKKYQKYFAFSVIAIVILVYAIWARSIKTSIQATPTPSLIPAGEASGDWGRLSDLTKDLGEPLNGNESGPKQGLYEYQSKNVNQANEVVYNNNNPVFFKQVVTEDDAKSGKSIVDKYGKAEIVLFGDLSELGYHLYAYPTKGIAYVGSEKGTLFEVWYFSPIDKETFAKTWAQNYSTAQNAPLF